MVECFNAARNLELQVLQEIILTHIVQIAEGEFRCELNIRLQEASFDHSAFSFSILNSR